MRILFVDRNSSSVLAKITNQISKVYEDNNIIGIKRNTPFQILSSYSSETVSIQKSPTPIAIIIKSLNP